MSPPRSSTRKRETTESIDTTGSTPTWNTSNNTLAAHIVALEEFVKSEHPRKRMLFEYGAISHGTRGETFFMSQNHVDRHRLNLIKKGSWLSPTIIDASASDLRGFPNDCECNR